VTAYPHRCRLHRVIFKDGRELRVIHRDDDMQKSFMDAAQAAVNNHSKMLGFAIVTLGAGNTHGCHYDFNSPLHPRSMPEIVRSVLQMTIDRNTTK
jgi:hypothetical protein